MLNPGHIREVIIKEETPRRCMTFPPEAVNEIFRYGGIVGSAIEHHARIPRGMDRARQLIRQYEESDRSFPSGTVIIADEMALPRGRFSRAWHAPRGGLWMTLVLVNTLLPESSLLVPMAAGVACCEVLRDYNVPAYLKWVNDVLAEKRKISGILTETFHGSRSGEEYILVGIGLNVNNNRFPPELSGLATSVNSCLQNEINLTALTARLLAKFSWNIGLLYFEEAQNLTIYGGVGKNLDTPPEIRGKGHHLLLESFKSLTDIFNRKVLFGFNVLDNPQFEAKVVGLDRSGGLLLELDDTTRVVRHGGEIIYLD